MSEDIQIRTVTVELLRAGPAHNQLLSPLTLYLGVCDDAEAGIVTLPFEHSTFLRRMRAMQYDAKHTKEDRLPELRAMGVEMAKVLGAIPRLAGSLTGDSRGRDLMVHLSLVLSASELASLPFELAKMPIGPTSWTESWLALQARVPVVITRRTRNVSPRDFRWLFEPRVLFISSDPAPDNVPFEEHKNALLDAVWPFLAPDDLPGEDGRPPGQYYKKSDSREEFGRVLTILTNPRFEEVVKECARLRYTHIHILAHGDMDKSHGDPTSGLRLHDKDGVISGERLASAFTRIVGGVIHRPDVVTLATCDSGKQETVMEPGASIAHTLHQAGVPLVLASQFPLGKEASTLIVQEFYGGLLWGEHPWVLLHRVRSTLHGQLTAQDHDWASLVVYESMPVPPDLDYKLDRARLAQCENALRATWQRVPEGERSPRWPLKRIIEKMPLNSRFFGMQAEALKADALLLQAQGEYLRYVGGQEPDSPKYDESPYKNLVIRNCGLLEEALEGYQAAVEGFLIYEDQGMSAPFMAMLAQLRLSAVLGNSRTPRKGRWAMTRYWCETTLDKSDNLQERIWALCCLAELWLLRLLESPVPGEGDVREHAKNAAREVARLDRQRFSEPVRWTVAQLKNYGKWWGHDPFERWVRNVCAYDAGSFQREGVVMTADAIVNIIDKDSERRVRALATAGPRGHDMAMPASWPEADERAKTAARPKPVAEAGSAEAVAVTPTPPQSPPQSPSPSQSSSPTPSPSPSPSPPAPPPAPAPEPGRLSAQAAAPAVRAAQASSVPAPHAAQAGGAPFLSIEMLAAAQGDALWIEYGRVGSKPSRVLIDCGTEGGYKALKARVLKVPLAERHFELFILSHIDSDHIGGAIPFLKDTEALGLSFGDVWFNGFKHLPQRQLGAAQGERFSALIQDKKLKWNAWQDGKAIVRPDDALPSLTLAGGLKLTLLSPVSRELAALAPTWEKEILALGDKPGDIDDARRRLGKRGAPDPNAEIDVDQLVDPRLNKFTGDDSRPNGSSIAVLAEFEGRSVLLGADAYSAVLEQAVQLLLKARPGATKLALDAFKLPHHASQNNLRPELLDMLTCRDYLVSTSGSGSSHHPDQVAIARVIRHGGPKPRLWFNYTSDETQVWQKPERQAKYGYTAIYGGEGGGLSYDLFGKD